MVESLGVLDGSIVITGSASSLNLSERNGVVLSQQVEISSTDGKRDDSVRRDSIPFCFDGTIAKTSDERREFVDGAIPLGIERRTGLDIGSMACT
jgi:hypothetical protein